MKKLFFDCGTHMFQGFQQFAEKYSIESDWECYCFEANPITYKMSKKKYIELLNREFDIKHFNLAVSDKKGTVDVNCALAYFYDESEDGSYTSQGSNILEKPPNFEHLNYDEGVHEVRTIDFSGFMREIVSPGDFVLIKMDIEGSEFSVLDRLIYDNTIEYINEIYVEFHEVFFENPEYYIERKEFYKKVFKEKGIQFNDWF